MTPDPAQINDIHQTLQNMELIGGLFLFGFLIVWTFIQIGQRLWWGNSGNNSSNATKELIVINSKISLLLEQNQKSLNVIKDQTDDLYKWHDVTDEDGRRLWYIKHSTEETLNNLSHTAERQTAILEKMAILLERHSSELDKTNEVQRRIERDISSISKDISHLKDTG